MIGVLIGLARDNGAILSLGSIGTLVGVAALMNRTRGSRDPVRSGGLERAILISKILDTVDKNKDRYRVILSRLDLEDLREIYTALRSSLSLRRI